MNREYASTLPSQQDQKSDVPTALEKKDVLSQHTLNKPKTKPEQANVQTNAKISFALDKSVSNLPITSMKHLSLPKGVETGPTKKHTSKGEDPSMDQEQAQYIMQCVLIKELQLEQHTNSNMSSIVQGKCLNPVSISKTNVLVHDAGKTSLRSMHSENKKHNMCDKLEQISTKTPTVQNESLQSKEITYGATTTFMRVSREEPDHEFNPEPNNKWKPRTELEQNPSSTKLSGCFAQSCSETFNSSIIHLFLPKEIDAGSGSKEDHMNNGLENKGEHTVQKKEKSELTIFQIMVIKRISLSHTCFVIDSSMMRIIHLSLPREIDSGSGSKEEYVDKSLGMQKKLAEHGKEINIVPNQRQISSTELFKSITLHQVQVSNHLINFVSNNPKNVIMHLMCPIELEKGLGTMENQPEPYSQVHTRGETKGETNCEIRDLPKEATFMPNGVSNKPWRGVIASMLIKEEPPDAQTKLHSSHNQNINRGNYLNPHRIQDTNLTYFCADPTILRTKFNQGGGYDEVIRSLDEPELYQTCHTSRIGVNKDIYAFLGAYGINPEDSKHETTWNTLSAHLEHTTNWNEFIWISNEEVLEFTNRVIPSLPDLDIPALIGGYQHNQDDLSHKSKFSTILTHQRLTTNWNQVNTSSHLEEIQFLRQRTLDLLHLEASTSQRIYCQSCCELDIFYVIQDVPKKLTYSLKPSRYKGGPKKSLNGYVIHFVLFFPYPSFVPMGFLGKVFNEANGPHHHRPI